MSELLVPSNNPQSPVVVSSMPRSGSTFLQRLLNAHPGLTIWGEHNGFLTPVRDAHWLVVDHRNSRNIAAGRRRADALIGPIAEPENFIPWVGAFSPREFEDALRDFLVAVFTAPLAPETRWGFEEIRYGIDELRFVQRLFPEAQYVLAVRDRRGQIRSALQAFGSPPDAKPERRAFRSALDERIRRLDRVWRTRMAGYATFAKDNPERVLVIGYRQLEARNFDVESLFQFLRMEVPDRELLAVVQASRAGATDAIRSEAWTHDRLAVLDARLDRLLTADAEVERITTELARHL